MSRSGCVPAELGDVQLAPEQVHDDVERAEARAEMSRARALDRDERVRAAHVGEQPEVVARARRTPCGGSASAPSRLRDRSRVGALSEERCHCDEREHRCQRDRELALRLLRERVDEEHEQSGARAGRPARASRADAARRARRLRARARRPARSAGPSSACRASRRATGGRFGAAAARSSRAHGSSSST